MPTARPSGPQLKISGAAVTVGQFGAWTPLGAEQTAGGYQVVWKNGGADQYVVWNTDSNGNFLSQGAVLSGTSLALESLETTFGQDLNGDGTIGVVTTVIEFVRRDHPGSGRQYLFSVCPRHDHGSAA